MLPCVLCATAVTLWEHAKSQAHTLCFFQFILERLLQQKLGVPF